MRTCLCLVLIAASHGLHVARRSALATAAAALAASPLSHPAVSHASASKLLEYAGLALQEPVREAAPVVEKNLAEQKLAEVLKQKVAEREKKLGFSLDADDILDMEKVLRNKYCGKGGLFYGEEGGTCKVGRATAQPARGRLDACLCDAQENVETAVLCLSNPRFSSTAGCPDFGKTAQERAAGSTFILPSKPQLF